MKTITAKPKQKPRPTKKSLILRHLQTGSSITPIEALRLYSLYRLSDAIFKLRAEGYPIITENITHPNGDTHARYTLR